MLSAFETELLSHVGMLKSVAIGLAKNRPTADDLVQQTLLKALENREKFREGTDMRGWLYTILRNEFLMSKKKREVFMADIVAICDAATGSAAVAPQESAVDIKAVDHALSLIDPDRREALFLTTFGGLSCDTVALRTGCKTGTVKSRVSRARRDLEDILSDPSQVNARRNWDGLRVIPAYLERLRQDDMRAA
jgi:RNA polymerase sigma-70 factor (ECF subfamily)